MNTTYADGRPMHPADVLENLGGRVHALGALGLLMIGGGAEERNQAANGAGYGMFYLAEDFDQARDAILAWLQQNRGTDLKPATGGAR